MMATVELERKTCRELADHAKHKAALLQGDISVYDRAGRLTKSDLSRREWMKTVLNRWREAEAALRAAAEEDADDCLD